MSILLAVNPPYAENIVNGTKVIEWRKTPLPLGQAYIYETKRGGGRGAVIGEVEVISRYPLAPKDTISDDAVHFGGVDRDTLRRYMDGKPICANIVMSIRRFASPQPIPGYETRPPQSWYYVPHDWYNEG